MENKTILEVSDIGKVFGGLIALQDVSFSLAPDEILGLIGPNGAGKTTLFNVVTGVLRPDQGNVTFQGEDITTLRPDTRCHLGIARTFQITKPFLNMSLLENVQVGAYFGNKAMKLNEAQSKAEEVLEFIGMQDLIHQEAKSLPIGGRKKLELARALATSPKILLLDEVIGGLTPTEVVEMMEVIKKIRESGVAIIMIEHVMKAVMGVSDRIQVLHYGKIIAQGTPQEITENPLVIEAYLGGSKHA